MRTFAPAFLMCFLVSVSNGISEAEESHAAGIALPPGRVTVPLVCESSILKMGVEYSVYLPAGYEKSGLRYPVLYLLHCWGDSCYGLRDAGLSGLIDSAIQHGEMRPVIVVTPSAARSWYINDYASSNRYEDFFIQEFIPHIDSRYRTLGTKAGRALAGFSMGGFGSLILAMKHPELFRVVSTSCAGISATNQLADDPGYEEFHGGIYAPRNTLVGSDRVNAHFLNNNPLYFIHSVPIEDMTSVHWFFEAATGDGYHTYPLVLLDRVFTERQIPHQFRTRNGNHDWDFYRSGLPDQLSFINKYLSGPESK